MYKYLSENELDTFSFHDCFINDILIIDNDVRWLMEHIDVKENNKCNTFPSDMQVNDAVITFKHCGYKNGRKQFSTISDKKDEYLKSNSLENINNIIKNCRMSYGESIKMGIAFFEIIQADYLFTFKVKYDSVIVEWNEFNKSAWYVR